MFNLLYNASNNTTVDRSRIGYYEELKVCSVEQVKRSKKRAIWVTAVLTAILVSILTFIICQGLPAKVYATEHLSLEVPAVTTEDKYIVQYKNIHSTIVDLYKVSPEKAHEYAGHIQKYSYVDFPTPQDIMAVIKIESSWDENAKSSADARGLMQVLHGHYEVQTNISEGTFILRQYYEILKDKRAAVIAYNVGIGSYKNGIWNEGYYKDYETQLTRIKTSNTVNTAVAKI